MTDFIFNPAAANKARDPYDGSDYGIELSAVPRARAPSYVSGNSFWPDEDNENLIKHDRKPSYRDGLKPDVNARVLSQTPTVRSGREKRRKLQGWRFGVTCSAWVAFTVLMMNVILTIYGGVKFSTEAGVGTAYTGRCENVNSWTTWLHILINALSSILLSASNYTMQCLCSPTRTEIDKAHAKGDWMDIGVASVRNIWRINWHRTVLWWLLALSSVPIHLLYNSAIFKTLDANLYTALSVSEGFLDGAPFNDVITTFEYGSTYNTTVASSNIQGIQTFFAQNYENGTAVKKLSNSDCMAAYGTSFVSDYNNVLAVTSSPTVGNYTLFFTEQIYYSPGEGGSSASYGWICNDMDEYRGSYACDVNSARKNASEWTLNNAPIEYCLAQISTPHCKLQFSIHILVTVILMNACKSICMFMTLFRQKEATLVTIGDAMASFLDRPDELTKGRCMMAKVDVGKGPLRWKARGTQEIPIMSPPAVTYYAPLRRRWFAGASIKRWYVTMGLCLAALLTGAALLGVGAAGMSSYLGGQTVFELGFGAVDSRALLNIGLPQGGAGGLVAAVLLANLPQAVVSFLYLTYNGLLTSMLLCHEYSKYAMDDRRKPLRVTTPHGQQRSTYYLNLPYTYSIPLLVASGTLHWLISQSIFLARLSIYTNGVSSNDSDYSEVGYSCLPILLVVLLGTAMLLFAVGMGCRKFASHIPVAGSCSVALAAAAHRPKNDDDAAYLPVRWGEVHCEGSDEVGHCCFTSEEVHDLIPGRMYAGAQQDASRHSSLRQRMLDK